jgi:hypothetical protein
MGEIGRPLRWTLGWVVLMVLLIMAAPSHRVMDSDPRASTFRTTDSGIRALYLTLEELGIPVAQRLEPLADAGPLPTALAIIEPTLPLTPREVAQVRAMVEAGGTLLYAAGESSRLREQLGLEESGFEPPVDTPAAPVRADGDRKAAPDSALERRVVFEEVRLGAGRVLLLHSAWPLQNGNIRGGGAFLFAAAAAEVTAGGDTLVFDEFHHGLRRSGLVAGVWRGLRTRPAGHALLQLGAVALLALLVAGRRFGAPVPLPRSSRRSPLEHVDALSRVYAEARAVTMPRVLLAGGLARRLNRPRPRSVEEARALVARLGDAAPAAHDAARQLNDVLNDDNADPGAVAHGVDRLLEQLKR